MAVKDNAFEGLVKPGELAGVAMPDMKPAARADTEALEAVEKTRDGKKFMEGVKERLATSAQGSTSKEYYSNKTEFDDYLHKIAQDPKSVEQLKEVAEGGDDEALNLAVQALGLRAALNAAAESRNPSAVKDIQGRLSSLQSRASLLPSSKAKMFVTRIISTTQSYAASVYESVVAAAARLLEGLGTALLTLGSAAYDLLAGGMSSSARNFWNSIKDNKLYQASDATVDGGGNVVFTKSEDIKGAELKQAMEQLNGKNTGMDNPLLKPGKLQILENDDVTGAARPLSELLEAERLEADFMRKSLKSLKAFKNGMLALEADQGPEAKAKAGEKAKANGKLFKAAEDQIDSVVREREALINAMAAGDAEEEKRAGKALKDAKAKLKTTLRRISDEVMGESPVAEISAATSVKEPGPAATAGGAKKPSEPNKGPATSV